MRLVCIRGVAELRGNFRIIPPMYLSTQLKPARRLRPAFKNLRTGLRAVHGEMAKLTLS
jgi:hypothetical protein